MVELCLCGEKGEWEVSTLDPGLFLYPAFQYDKWIANNEKPEVGMAIGTEAKEEVYIEVRQKALSWPDLPPFTDDVG